MDENAITVSLTDEADLQEVELYMSQLGARNVEAAPAVGTITATATHESLNRIRYIPGVDAVVVDT